MYDGASNTATDPLSRCTTKRSLLVSTTATAGSNPKQTLNHRLHLARGTVRFHVPGKPDIDAKEGDFVSVPVRAPHTFSNPHDVEAKFFNTYTPAFYINYFKLLGSMIEEGEKMTPEKNLEAMANYATLPVPKEKMLPGERLVE